MSSPVQYNGGLNCSLAVTDLNRSIAWYQDILGFELIYKIDDMGWCELKTEISGVQIGLSQVEKHQPTPAGATLTFGVVDIDHSRRLLEQKNVRFDGPTRNVADMVRLATFFDPDGNTLMFYQDVPKK